MANQPVRMFGWIVLLGAMVGGCASEGTTGGANGVAAGSVEDSLTACQKRIPSNATSGQQMLAEQSCQRDQTIRR